MTLITPSHILIMKGLYQAHGGPAANPRNQHGPEIDYLLRHGYIVFVKAATDGKDDAEYKMTYDGNVALNQSDDDCEIIVPRP